LGARKKPQALGATNGKDAATVGGGGRAWVASRARRLDFAGLAALGMAVGLIGVGALSLIFQDFAEVWQPVPKSFPAYATSAVVSGLILIVAGVMLAFRWTRPWGAGLAAAFLALWVLGLHLPHALAKPLVIGGWQAVCESLAMASGAFIGWRETTSSGQANSGQDSAARAAVTVMGVCFVVFGVSHFVYARFTTDMVPAFLPMRPQLTYLTGAIHALAGLALILGVRRRWAASIEALMMSSFVLLVHIPRVAAAPHDRMELTSLFIATTLTSAVRILATSRALARR
jgi:uncharacterized membrane protein